MPDLTELLLDHGSVVFPWFLGMVEQACVKTIRVSRFGQEFLCPIGIVFISFDACLMSEKPGIEKIGAFGAAPS